MSVRSEKAAAAPTNALSALVVSNTDAPLSSDSLAEGNNYCVANPDNPLKRNVVVSIKATLNDFCLQKTRGTWAPTQEALRNICKLAPSNRQPGLYNPDSTDVQCPSLRSPAA
jgi:hypothetical protein